MKTNRIRFLSILLAMLLALTACGGSNGGSGNSSDGGNSGGGTTADAPAPSRNRANMQKTAGRSQSRPVRPVTKRMKIPPFFSYRSKRPPA